MSELGFVKFCKENCKTIISSLEICTQAIPIKMNQMDYRFEISKFLCYCLAKSITDIGEYRILSESYSRGYDMVFAETAKISVKIQKEIFQKPNKKKNGLTLPKKIIMKNFLGETKNMDLDIDYLLAIQRGKSDSNNEAEIGFGVISIENLMNLPCETTGDQLKIQIHNDKLDFFSGLHKIQLANNVDIETEQNRIYSNGQIRTYDLLLDSARNIVGKVKKSKSKCHELAFGK